MAGKGTRNRQPRIAHQVSGRIRIALPQGLQDRDAKTLINDLKLSPQVTKVTLRGSSLIIEHADDEKVLGHTEDVLRKLFPGFERWSDEFDAELAKYTANPWVNKTLPLGFLGLAIYTGLRNGAVLAGESAFALAYVAFDLYWKFQQENVIRKIETGLSQHDKDRLEQSS